MFPYHPGLRSPNELSRLMQTRALVDFGELSLNRAMRVYGPVGDLSFREGLFYPSKAPLLSFAAAPVYVVFRNLAGGQVGAVPEIPLIFFARLFLTIAPTLILLVLLRRFLETYVDGAAADLFVVFYALGTLAFSYSLQFLSHQTTADLLFGAFYVGWRWVRGDWPIRTLVLAGFLAALAVTAEYTSAMAAGMIAIWIVLGRSGSARARVVALGTVAAGALVPLTLLGLYHWRCFGGPLETGYKHLADAAYQPWHLGGFLGIRTPDPRAFVLSLFSPLRGLFALSPGLLLGIAGLRRLWMNRSRWAELGPIAVFTGTLVLAYLYFTSSFSYESWGWATGPRHMTGLIPFLLLPAALLYCDLDNDVARGIARGLLAGSMLVTGCVTLVNYIPDNVSEPLFGLFVPLALRGDLVPSVLSFLGFLNPFSAALFVLLILTLSLYVCFWHVLEKRRGTAAVLSATSLTVVLMIHGLTYRDTDGDKAARALLSSVWLTPAGLRPCFWCTSGRL